MAMQTWLLCLFCLYEDVALFLFDFYTLPPMHGLPSAPLSAPHGLEKVQYNVTKGFASPC